MATATDMMKNGDMMNRHVFVLSAMTEEHGFQIHRVADIELSPPKRFRDAVFVSLDQSSTDDLLKRLLRKSVYRCRRGRMGELLTLKPPRPESVPSLTGLFNRVTGTTADYLWLPIQELATVMKGENAAERFIGGAIDPESETLALVRGNCTTLVVPFSYFKKSGDGTKPDFRKLSFADYGLTVSLGMYEASADGILYEFDAKYRQKLNKERKASEQSFGASLRRLRLQRQLKRSDFPGIASKTIARIERNEVEKPHGKTLETIAKRLGVNAKDIESY